MRSGTVLFTDQAHIDRITVPHPEEMELRLPQRLGTLERKLLQGDAASFKTDSFGEVAIRRIGGVTHEFSVKFAQTEFDLDARGQIVHYSSDRGRKILLPHTQVLAGMRVDVLHPACFTNQQLLDRAMGECGEKNRIAPALHEQPQ